MRGIQTEKIKECIEETMADDHAAVIAEEELRQLTERLERAEGTNELKNERIKYLEEVELKDAYERGRRDENKTIRERIEVDKTICMVTYENNAMMRKGFNRALLMTEAIAARDDVDFKVTESDWRSKEYEGGETKNYAL